jgi:2'-5' RNA ligase
MSKSEKSDEAVLLRAFVAIDLPDDVRAELARTQAKLKKAEARVSWVPLRNIHLSLAFLGDIPQALVPRLSPAFDIAGEGLQPFEFVVNGIGSFGSKRRPRVIWAGVQRPPESLFALQEKVADIARRFDIPVERRKYKPHLTLGRVRGPRNLDALTSAMSSAMNTRHGVVPVTRFSLMRSELRPDGAEYTVLHESSLKGD